MVHLDVGALTGDDADARARLEDGPVLAAQVAQCLGCDAEVVTVSESCGLPIDVGRRRRVVSTRLRRALEARDRCCRFPGCAVPARMAHAHHIRHWAQGGRTDLANVVSLCGFHHRRLHGGIYAIRVQKDGTLRFETADGTSIGPDTWRLRRGSPCR